MVDKKLKKQACKTKGRPCSYNREEALQKATEVFCRYGYDNASVSQLGDAMGMNPPSLYNAFGDKETLFANVLDFYHASYRGLLEQMLQQSDINKALEQFFESAKMMLACENSVGCLIVNTSLKGGGHQGMLAQKIKDLHDYNEQAMLGIFKAAQARGQVSQNCDVVALARFAYGLVQGAAVLARGQQSPKAVADVLDTGLKALKYMIK